MTKTVSVIHKQRTNTEAAWSSGNPVLALGQIGVVSDTTPKKIKIGDGTTAWNSLPYIMSNDFSDTYKGLLDFLSGYNSVTTLASMPVSKRVILATVSTATSLSLASTLADGRELLIKLVNSTASAITQPLPTTGSYKSEKPDGTAISSVTLPASGKLEISIVAINGVYYIKTDA